jgi:hypothetical protein
MPLGSRHRHESCSRAGAMFLNPRLVLLSCALASAAFAQEDAPRYLRTVGDVERFEDLGQPVNGFHLVTATRHGVIVSGGLIFLGSWAFTGATGISETPASFIPVVGAFIVAGRISGSISPTNGFLQAIGSLAVATYVAAGVLQLGGIAMAALGAAFPIHWLERDVGGAKVTVLPAPGGASVIARF